MKRLLAILGVLVLAACATEPAPKPAFKPLAADEEAVLLLRDLDGGVGAVVVTTPDGMRALNKIDQGTSYRPGRAPGKATIWPRAKVEAVFGRALAVAPKAPETFVFRFDRTTNRLDDASRARLPAVQGAAKDRPVVRLVVAGHSALSGSRRVNIDRSRKWALMMRSVLTGEGFKPSAIVLKAYGEARPMFDFFAGEPAPRDAWVEVTVQ